MASKRFCATHDGPLGSRRIASPPELLTAVAPPVCGAALTQLRHNKATDAAVHCSPQALSTRAGKIGRSTMKFTAGKVAVAMVAIGVTLGGCATRESVRNAQSAAD